MSYGSRPKRSAEELMAAMEDHMPQEIIAVPEQVADDAPANAPTAVVMTADAEEDYDFVRKKLKGLLEASQEAIELGLELAKGSEHPRSFEVLSGMIKDAAEISTKITTLQEKRRKLNTRPSAKGHVPAAGDQTAGAITNNNIFVGSTTDLQKFLKEQREKAAAVEVEANAETEEERIARLRGN